MLQLIKSKFLQLFSKPQPRPVIKADITTLAPNDSLRGKRIMITGGNRGLGFAMAQKFLGSGAAVIITGRNEEKLKESAETLHCPYMVLNLNDVTCLQTAIYRASDLLGGLDTLVNNAGISLHEMDFTEVTPESFDKQINTNLRGPFFLMKAFIEYLKERKEPGTILYISSETGETVDLRPYGWSKAAINSMVKGLAYRLIKDNIRINALAPGVTATEMTGFDKNGDLTCDYNPNGRVYLPREMAEVAAFLISDLSGCISGQILTCNNGKTINARWK